MIGEGGSLVFDYSDFVLDGFTDDGHLIPLTGEMPHGGFKCSGYGKDLSAYSLDEYTRVKHVMSAND